MLNSCFFFLIGIGLICEKNFREDIPETAWKNTKAFCDQLKFSIIQVSLISWNFSKSAQKCFHFFAKMIDLCLLTQKNQTLLPSLGRQGQSAPCNIIARLSVCLSVSSINAWASNSSLNGGSTWCPVQSFSSGPVRSWSQLCGSPFTPLFTRSRSDHRSAASCGRPLLCAGSFESFCSLELACQVCWSQRFSCKLEALRSVQLA